MKTIKRRQKIRNALLLLSFLLFPVTLNYFSPVLPIVGAANSVIVGSLLLFGALFLSALFLGRGFCAWICPAGAMQDYCTNINSRKTKGGKFNYIKWIIWFPWFLFILILLIKNGVNELSPLFFTETGVSVDEPLKFITYYLVTGSIVLLAFLVGKRSFCHYGCWIAPFMILGTKLGKLLKIPSLKLRVNTHECNTCKVCSFNCPMSLPVHEMVNKGKIEHSECILCGNCVDTCKKQVIKYTFKQ